MFNSATLTRREIDERIVLLNSAAPWWVEVWRMVRDHGLRLISVKQAGKRPFWPLPPANRRGPCLVYLGDDMETSKGPRAFHRASLKRLFRDTYHVVINAADTRHEPYTVAGAAAVFLELPIVLIECLPETQDAWIRFAKSCGKTDGDFLVFGVTGYPVTACEQMISMPIDPLPKPTLQ